ncbi:MAG: protein-L-isoaspartate(D-aspartate) O-methyltransferase [Candidatus Omnitrophica bacterium]|nr:protein-L-isoaspartate(D-aspartate) O-methyltransferase [Candidatus Omnitrophota bacterium]MCB9720336.1 protein-L-isoaspartate(D-aspartate) O-methyltransferase [Candidatus Omnitrophota bacterium]
MTRFFRICGVIAVMSGIPFFGCARAGDFEQAHDRMIAEQLIPRGIEDTRVLAAMRKVRRHEYVPKAVRDRAYDDGPLPIGHGQTISQPYIVAVMTQVLEPKDNDKVLEIGTGSGYQAAVLAEIVDQVYTIEIVGPLADEARAHLKKQGYTNITVRHGDGYRGWPEHAPFDKIIVTAAPPEVPPRLVEQLKVGGRMVLPVGEGYQQLIVLTKTDQGVVTETLFPVRFVPMVPGP